MKDICRVVWDEKTGNYYSYRADCPREEYKPISLGAILDLEKNMRRYEEDGFNELLYNKK